MSKQAIVLSNEKVFTILNFKHNKKKLLNQWKNLLILGCTKLREVLWTANISHYSELNINES